MSLTKARQQKAAHTILAQLSGIRNLSMMVGAKDFFSMGAESKAPNGGVQFRFDNGRICRVYLRADDTYRMTITKPKRLTQAYIKRLLADETIERETVLFDSDEEYGQGLYFDMLMDTFEERTGLYLTFNKREAA